MRHSDHLRELDRLTGLAFDEAIRLEHSFVGDEHFLLALLHPSHDTAAARALRSCGVSYDVVSDELARSVEKSDPPPPEFDPEAGIFLSFAGGALVARAEGIAVGLGEPLPREEHVLLAYLWDYSEEWPLDRCGTTRAAVFERLSEEDAAMPAVPLPPTRVPPAGRYQQVDIPPDRLSDVRSAMLRLLPEDANWGWNVHSATNRAWIVLISDELDLEDLVQQALALRA